VRARTGLAAGLVAVAALAGVGAVRAQAAPDEPFRLEARVEPDRGVTDTQPVRLVIQIAGTSAPELRSPRLPTLRNLRVVQGPFSSSNFQWVNGKTSATLTLTYTLLALEPGPAEVPPIELEIGGRTYRTEAIRIDVSRGATAPPAHPGPGSGSQAGPRAGGGNRPAEAGADVYLRARLSKASAWVGEPVLLEVELLDGVGVSGFDWVTSPSFSNFWVEDDDVRPEAESFVDTVGGRRFRVWPLVRKVLIPTRSGRFEIEPYAARVGVPVRGTDPFLDMFRGRTETAVRKTDPLALEVRELPDDGRPAGFGGAVGRFEIEGGLDRTDATVDEAVGLRVTVRGRGFLKSAPVPDLPSSPQMRVFEPETTDRTAVRRGELTSEKTWEWVLVPLGAGEVDVPEVSLPYFDPEEGRYRVLTYSPGALTVAGNAAGGRRAAGGALRPERRDIAYVKALLGGLRANDPPLHGTTLFHVLLWSPLVWVPVVVFAGRRRARLRSDRGHVRARGARARARKRLAGLERRTASLDGATFHEEIARALVEWVADRFDRSAAGLTYDVADALLASRGVPEGLRGEFRRCLETCDFARFVPSSDAQGRREERLQEARSLIERLERAL